MKHKNIHLNIKKIRELKSFNRKVLADHLNMTLSGYAKIEQGSVDISLKKLEIIANFLEVDLFDLIHYDSSKILYGKNKFEAQDPNQSVNDDFSNTKYVTYLHKLIKSLERENLLLREKLSNEK